MSLQQNLQRLYQQKDWKSLLEICNQELAKQPGQAQYYYLKAVSLSMLSQEQEARKNLEKCLALSPEFPNARDFLMSLEKRSSHAKISVDSQRTVSQSSSIDLKGSLDEKGTIVQDTHSGYSTQKGSLDEKGTIVQEKYDEKKIDQIKTLEQQEEKKLLEKNAEPGEEGDKRFGRYKILADLGEGGMGHVYKAFDPELKRVIALKVIRGDKVNQKQMDRFLREAQTTAKLHHPNIVSVYDIGVQDGWPFFTMDFIEGQGLDKYCKESLPKSDKLSIIFMKIAEAIQYAHDNGVIHRDIKPANIMITKDEQPKVMDFGLAKIAKEDQKISRSGAVLGTPAYMPPEQAQGKEVDARSDVYSIGATMYECLTGFPPFRTNNYTKLMQEIISKEPKLPRQYNLNIPQDLQTICMKCLEKPPLLRYQKAKHFWEDIKLFVEYKPIKARPASMYQKASKWIYRNRKMAAAGLLATLGFIVAFLWLRVNFSQTWEKEVYLQNKKILEKAKNHKKNQRYDLAREAWLEIKKDTAQYTEAQKELEEIRLFLEQTEKQGDLLSEKGLACESLEEIEEAKKCYEKILGCYPRHPQVYPKFLNMEKSVLEIKNKKHREARNFYDKAMLISSSPTLRIEDLENCYRLFSRAVEIDPSFADAYFQRGRTCQRRFMYKEAFKDYNQSIKLEPALSAAHYYRILMEYAIIMGEISDSGEDQVERKKELFDYLQKNPSQKDDVYAILLEAYACIEDIKPGGIAKAIEHCNSAEKIAPYFADTYFLRASLQSHFMSEYNKQGFSELVNFQFLKKNYEKAWEDLAKYMSMMPKSPLGYKLRGIIRNELGDFKGAIQDFKQYLLLIPVRDARQEKCVQRMTRAFLLLKRFEEALPYLDRLIEDGLKIEQGISNHYYEQLSMCYLSKAISYMTLKNPEKASQSISLGVEIERKGIQDVLDKKRSKEQYALMPLSYFMQALFFICEKKDDKAAETMKIIGEYLHQNFKKELLDSIMPIFRPLQDNQNFNSMLSHYPDLFLAPPELKQNLFLLKSLEKIDLIEKLKLERYGTDVFAGMRMFFNWIDENPGLEKKFNQLSREKLKTPLSFLFVLKMASAIIEMKSLKILDTIQNFDSAELYYRQALMYYFIKDDPASCISALNKAWQKDPGFMEAHYALAILYAAESKKDSSLEANSLFHLWMAKQLGWNHIEYTQRDPAFDKIKDSPLFSAITTIPSSPLKEMAGLKWSENIPFDSLKKNLLFEFSAWNEKRNK